MRAIGAVTHRKISDEYVIKKRWLRGHARNWDSSLIER